MPECYLAAEKRRGAAVGTSAQRSWREKSPNLSKIYMTQDFQYTKNKYYIEIKIYYIENLLSLK